MSAFDLRNQSMQCTEPEIDYITPQMKPRDEMLVFIDGKWVNEIYCQPHFPSQLKLFSKKAQNEWSIREENRVLWQKNQVLQIKNRMLWEENKALQCLQSQNKAIQVIYTNAMQQSLQNENKPFPFFKERTIGFQFNPGHKALQAVQEQNKVLEDYQQETKTVPVTWKDQKAMKVHEESKDATSDLQKNTIIAVEKGNPGPVLQQEHEGKKKSISSTQNKTESAPRAQGEYEILHVLQDLCELFHIFLKMNHLPREKQGCQNLYDVNRSFQEDYNKLKLHLHAVKSTVSDIRVLMEMLEKEIIAITSPMYEEGGQKLATEHLFEDM
ncbi:PREDICTED: spermatid-associated protein [Acanthisitta chloris]|uniref:Spermatid-associated protein n=1 Tax=Acanthisitta chloris TaxID=57068 RepID=A0A091NH15_9PASS|nr:PREDICTED: spermatid-associated protein [Acanthisitta chloris]KFP77956.1 Spermatid-associated protein [Acanthisitta chloris]